MNVIPQDEDSKINIVELGPDQKSYEGLLAENRQLKQSIRELQSRINSISK